MVHKSADMMLCGEVLLVGGDFSELEAVSWLRSVGASLALSSSCVDFGGLLLERSALVLGGVLRWRAR
jgi:hypothetical protein